MSEEPPALPQVVSGNGAEIWDWASRLSEWSQRQQRIRELQSDISRRPRECGACRLWMTRQCPKERNINGRNHGPSMKSLICSLFAITKQDADRLVALQAELDVLLSDRAEPTP